MGRRNKWSTVSTSTSVYIIMYTYRMFMRSKPLKVVILKMFLSIIPITSFVCLMKVSYEVGQKQQIIHW